jgi:hypothetical protein
MKPLAAAILLLLTVVCGAARAADKAFNRVDRLLPIMQFHSDRSDPAYSTVDLRHHSARLVRHLQHAKPSLAEWHAWFSVFVDNAEQPPGSPLPPVLGKYKLLSDGVSFWPTFPFVSGLADRAVSRPSVLARRNPPGVAALRRGSAEMIIFSVPRATTPQLTAVTNVFPSSDELPENLLRFYVYFSAPMQRGDVFDHVVLLGPGGRPVEADFLTLELWDPAMQRLTLLLAPGRIKRGVRPNRDSGPALLEGQNYTLMIDAGLADALGRPMARGYAKRFRVTQAIRSQIDPASWTSELPTAGAREPLVLGFPRPLDRAMLLRSISVVDAHQHLVAGDIELCQHETQWTFTPRSDWVAGRYQVQIDSVLEDVSGNNLRAAFDIDDRSNAVVDNAGEATLPLQLSAPAPSNRRNNKEFASK